MAYNTNRRKKLHDVLGFQGNLQVTQIIATSFISVLKNFAPLHLVASYDMQEATAGQF